MKYETGKPYLATVRGERDVLVLFTALGDFTTGANVGGSWTHPDSHVTDVRGPLVMLDLPEGARDGWPFVLDALRRARETTGLRMTFSDLIDQIEAQTRDPKPDEPLGLGAVVEDSKGAHWTRVDMDAMPWLSVKGGPIKWGAWHDIDAVRVLSEGVR